MKRIQRAVQILSEDRPRLGAIMAARNELQNYLESEQNMERKLKVFQYAQADQLERAYAKWTADNHHVKVTERQITANLGELILMVFYDDNGHAEKETKK